MAFCKNCGAQINDKAVICPKCGVAQSNIPAINDKGSFCYGLLGFCIPLVGLILYLVWKDTQPSNAKVAGTGALIAVIIGVVFYILMFVVLAGVGTAMN